MRYLLILFVFLVASCSLNHSGKSFDTYNITVESSVALKISSINNIIEKALDDGEEWPFSPLQITFKVLGNDQEIQKLNLIQEANLVENPDLVTSVIIRDGFLDDSVRGDWHQITFSKEANGSWRIIEIQRAHRCWREDSNIYRSDLCP